MNKTAAPRTKLPSITRTSAVLQRKCECGRKLGAGHECEECKRKREERLHRSPRSGATPARVPPVVDRVLNSPGRPLDPATRSHMEGRFGRDFGDVRVHTDSLAGQSARALNARAYTVGNSIAFDHGAYQPHTPEGGKLLAHELAHTLQQGGPHRSANDLRVDPADSALEREAERIADAVTRAGGPAPVIHAVGPRISRLPTDSLDATRDEAQRLTIAGFEELPVDPQVTLDARRFQALKGFVVPGVKGSKAVDAWRKQGGELGLETLIDIEGNAAPKVALKQVRDDTNALRTLWLGRVGWTEGEKQKLWEDTAKTTKNTAGDFPKVNDQTCQLDHIVELQIGGTNEVANMQMLNAAPNRTSGQEVRAALAEDAKTIRSIVGNVKYIFIRYKTFAQTTVEDGPCYKMDLEAANVKGTAKAPESGEAYPIRLEKKGEERTVYAEKDKKQVTRLFASDVTANKSAGEMIPGLLLMTLSRAQTTHTVQADFDNRKGTRIPLDVKQGKVDMEVAGGVLRLSEKAKKHPNILFTYPYLSEGKVTRLDYDPQKGLSGDGEITPSIPLLKGVTLKIHFSPEELSIVGKLPTDKLKTPIPGFQIHRADLGLALYPEFKPSGTLEFAVGPRAKPVIAGTLEATAEAGEFVATGKMTAHVPGVDETTGTVTYRKSTGWVGTLKLTSSHIPGVKTAAVDATLTDQGLAVAGGLSFELAGGHKFDLGVEYKEGKPVTYSGKANIEVPGLKEVELDFVYDGQKISGHGKTQFTFLGTTGTLNLFYDKDDIYGSGEFHIEKGKAKGKLLVKMSRAPHHFSGEGEVTYQLTPNLVTTVGILVDENQKVTVKGAVEFPKPIPLFKAIEGKFTLLEVGTSLPIPGLSIPGVGLMIRIEGALGAGFGIGPGTFEKVRIEGAFNPFEKDPDPKLDLGGSLVIPAHARLNGSISGSLEITATIASADAGLKVTASAGLVGGFTANAKVHYEKTRFAVHADFNAILEVELGLDLDAFVRLQAGIGPYKAMTRWDWNLASYRYKPGLQLGVQVPIDYASHQEFKPPSTNDIRFVKPTIDPESMLKRIFGTPKKTEAQ